MAIQRIPGTPSKFKEEWERQFEEIAAQYPNSGSIEGTPSPETPVLSVTPPGTPMTERLHHGSLLLERKETEKAKDVFFRALNKLAAEPPSFQQITRRAICKGNLAETEEQLDRKLHWVIEAHKELNDAYALVCQEKSERSTFHELGDLYEQLLELTPPLPPNHPFSRKIIQEKIARCRNNSFIVPATNRLSYVKLLTGGTIGALLLIALARLYRAKKDPIKTFQ